MPKYNAGDSFEVEPKDFVSAVTAIWKRDSGCGYNPDHDAKTQSSRYAVSLDSAKGAFESLIEKNRATQERIALISRTFARSGSIGRTRAAEMLEEVAAARYELGYISAYDMKPIEFLLRDELHRIALLRSEEEEPVTANPAQKFREGYAKKIEALAKSLAVAKEAYGDRLTCWIRLGRVTGDDLVAVCAYLKYTTSEIIIKDPANRMGRRIFGPYRISHIVAGYNDEGGSLIRWVEDEKHTAAHCTSYLHPHIDRNGSPCLGSWGSIFKDARNTLDIRAIFGVYDDYLRHGVCHGSTERTLWSVCEAVCDDCDRPIHSTAVTLIAGKAYHKDCLHATPDGKYYPKSETRSINGRRYHATELVIADGALVPKVALAEAGPYGLPASAGRVNPATASHCERCSVRLVDRTPVESACFTGSPWSGIVMPGGETVCALCLPSWYEEREVDSGKRRIPEGVWGSWKRAAAHG